MREAEVGLPYGNHARRAIRSGVSAGNRAKWEAGVGLPYGNHARRAVRSGVSAGNRAKWEAGVGLPYNRFDTLCRRIQKYTNKACGFSVWQRSFHDHVIRDDADYRLHWRYINENPKKWLMGKDAYYS